jgi:hypothetical protein
MKENTLSIWFLIGILLAIYGAIITLSGLYHFLVPPATLPVLGQFHADFWWGLFLFFVGMGYARKFRPSKK